MCVAYLAVQVIVEPVQKSVLALYCPAVIRHRVREHFMCGRQTHSSLIGSDESCGGVAMDSRMCVSD